MQIADALKNLKKYDFIDKLILILMFFYLLIDAVNGLMLRYYSCLLYTSLPRCGAGGKRSQLRRRGAIKICQGAQA